MGKRELLLIVAFIFAGTLLYQATAPPSPDGGFSWSNWTQNIRKHIGPRHEYLADERTLKLPLEAGVTEVRIAGVQSLHIEGTDSADASAKLQVYSTGNDENEARALGKRTLLKSATSGDILSLEMDYPPEERQRTTMTVTLPRKMRVRISRASTSIEVTGIAGLEFAETRGDATVTKVTGTIRGTHTGGELNFDTVANVDMTARRSDITIKNMSGDLRLDLTGGQLMAHQVAGEVSLNANRVSLELDGVKGALTADLTQGSLEVTNLSEHTRVDARGSEVRLELARAAAVTVITTDENISVRLPEHAGVSLDATVEDGEIRVPENAPKPTMSDRTGRAIGPINGGGPTIALRTSHGDIIIR